ncbi:hypothetical protein MTR_4g007690 [Medicago truncatula]|uniref:Uncharacterized protein n=1 Tax=Medicago truncatula TaxID=3880 RepID=A0A072URS2_MEDTR|nr:hypothetical protein MTR_4g007690 [Medicago truncatula]
MKSGAVEVNSGAVVVGGRNDAEKLPVVVVVQKGREEEYCFHVREKEMKERKKNKGVIGVK